MFDKDNRFVPMSQIAPTKTDSERNAEVSLRKHLGELKMVLNSILADIHNMNDNMTPILEKDYTAISTRTDNLIKTYGAIFPELKPVAPSFNNEPITGISVKELKEEDKNEPITGITIRALREVDKNESTGV